MRKNLIFREICIIIKRRVFAAENSGRRPRLILWATVPGCRLLVRFRGGEKHAVYLPDQGNLFPSDYCGSGWGCGPFGSVCGRLQWKYKGHFFPGSRDEGGRCDPALRRDYLRAASNVLPRSAVLRFARGNGAESLIGCLMKKTGTAAKRLFRSSPCSAFPVTSRGRPAAARRRSSYAV